MKTSLLITICLCSILFQPTVQAANSATAFIDKLEINAVAMFDYENFDGLHNNNIKDDDYTLRRASLRFTYEHNETWRAKIKFAYGEDEQKLEIQDLEISTQLFDGIDLSVGRFKEPVGLEYSTSSRDLLLLERSMVTEAFVARRNIGLQLSRNSSHDTGGQHWAVGLFDNGQSDTFDTMALSGRYSLYFSNEEKTWPAWFPKKSLIHIGLSGSLREENPENSIRINQNIELYNGDTIVESNRIDADSRKITALEAALSVGAFHIQTEMMLQAVKANPDSNDQDSQYSGSYIQVGYFLSGQTLRYDDNRFESVRPRSSTKVWLLVARYSELDARDNDLGSEAKNLSLGLNYYLNRQFKFMLNVSRSELSGRNAIFADTGNAISFRAQYQF